MDSLSCSRLLMGGVLPILFQLEYRRVPEREANTMVGRYSGKPYELKEAIKEYYTLIKKFEYT
ncbi:MAG: hypothetical protein QXO29_07285 [Nitrososphaerota archaeon]